MAEKWSQMHDSIKYHKDLTPRERIIFCDIRDLTKNGEGLCKARNRYLATKHGISARTISRAVTKFVELGLLAIEMNHANNTRHLRVIETRETAGQKCPDVVTKLSSRVDKNVVTYRQKCLPLYKEEKDNRELQGRESGPEPPTLSQIEFCETFSDIPNNAPFDDAKHDMELLASRIKTSRFVYANAKQFGAKWLIKRYAKIIADEYADFVLLPQQSAAASPPPAKTFMRHDYSPGELGSLITDLDNVSYS